VEQGGFHPPDWVKDQLPGSKRTSPGLRGASPRGHAPRRRRGRAAAAAGAQRLRPDLTYALPHLAVQTRIELARTHVVLGDLAGARTLIREIGELLRRRPGLGTLTGEARPFP